MKCRFLAILNFSCKMLTNHDHDIGFGSLYCISNYICEEKKYLHCETMGKYSVVISPLSVLKIRVVHSLRELMTV